MQSGDFRDLVAAGQYRAFADKIPTFYWTLIVAVAVSSAYFHGTVPAWLTTAFPAVMLPLCIYRALWWTRHRGDEVSMDTVRAQLRRMMTLSIVLGISFSAWNVLLFVHSVDAPVRQQVLFVWMCLSAAYCYYFLMHLRGSMLVVTLVIVPLIVTILLWDREGSWAISALLAIFFVAMTLASKGYYRDFAMLQESRFSLLAQQERVKALSDENLRIANMDALTELPNRRQFFTDLKRVYADCEAGRFVVGVIDLDGFKAINDAHGHLLGDAILREVARRFAEDLGDGLTIYRLGGDEFAFIHPESNAEAALIALGDRIIAVVRKPFVIRELRLCVDCSIGFAVRQDKLTGHADLYEQADYALYHAKRMGRGRSMIFTQEHAHELREHWS